MEEIGYRTTTFEFGGVSDNRPEFISWLLKTYARDGVKPADLMDADAIDLLAERLRTALLNAKPAEVRDFLAGDRAREFTEQLRVAGVPV